MLYSNTAIKYMSSFFLVLSLLLSLSLPAFAHGGRTDSNGGHYNRSTGEYHYHHGYSAHQHPNGICPYNSSSQSGSSQNSSNNTSKNNEQDRLDKLFNKSEQTTTSTKTEETTATTDSTETSEVTEAAGAVVISERTLSKYVPDTATDYILLIAVFAGCIILSVIASYFISRRISKSNISKIDLMNIEDKYNVLKIKLDKAENKIKCIENENADLNNKLSVFANNYDVLLHILSSNVLLSEQRQLNSPRSDNPALPKANTSKPKISKPKEKTPARISQFKIAISRWLYPNELAEVHRPEVLQKALDRYIGKEKFYNYCLDTFVEVKKTQNEIESDIEYLKQYAAYIESVCDSSKLNEYPHIKCKVLFSGAKVYFFPFDSTYSNILVGTNSGDMYAHTITEAVSNGFTHALDLEHNTVLDNSRKRST